MADSRNPLQAGALPPWRPQFGIRMARPVSPVRVWALGVPSPGHVEAEGCRGTFLTWSFLGGDLKLYGGSQPIWGWL